MIQSNKKNAPSFQKALALFLALAMSLLLLPGCQQGSSSGGGGAAKSITLTVTHRDGSTKEFKIQTTQETLGAALQDEGLIEGEEGQYGLFITTVDGEKADDGNHEFWSLSSGGEMLNTGVDSTPVEDGASFELTLSTY